MQSQTRKAFRWPKRHTHVVEECGALTVRDLSSQLPQFADATTLRWRPSPHTSLTLIARQAGSVRRWWFRCPRCARPRESLFVPPTAQPNDWRCRRCWNLIYASQRYGRRHPLRQKLTPRKRVSAIMADARRRRAEVKRLREWEERRRLDAIEAEARAERAARQREHDQARQARRREAQDEMRAILASDVAENQIYVDAIAAKDLSPRSMQGRAARMLARAARSYGVMR